MSNPNPLIVPRADTPASPWSGVWIAEDIQLIGQGVRNGSWIEAGLGTVSAGLDTLAIITDPLGALLQYGVAWIIEHVRPLTEALDWLAGDPAQITAQAQTWRNTATSLRASGDDLVRAARHDVSEWTGAAADTYRAWSAQQQGALDALADAAAVMADITEAAAYLIAGVRILVRDAIATLVSRLLSYAAEVVFTLGAATPVVIGQVTTLVAAWSARIARLLHGLLGSLRALAGRSEALTHLIDQLKKILTRLRGKDPDPGPGPGPQTPNRFDGLSRDDLAAGRGANIGRPGRGRGVREVRSEEDLRDYFDALTRDGATELSKPGFPGRILRLEDGTVVTWRTKSKTTGEIPTVDVNPANGDAFKIHIDPDGW